VLALQGDFARHLSVVRSLGVSAIPVTLPEHLDGLEALLLPGGESTTMLKLMESNGLREPLASFVRSRPVLGTCAGLILLATEASALPHSSFGVLDVTVERNAYGRQIDSFSAPLEVPVLEAAGGAGFHGVFIRAPRIRRVGSGVEVVAWRAPGAGGRGEGAGREPVGVRHGRVVGLAFHPELTADLRLHAWFLTAVAGLRVAAADLAHRPSFAAAMPGARA
jgi:pyridoxal 5'-phosphate synthase pdxT subunit